MSRRITRAGEDADLRKYPWEGNDGEMPVDLTDREQALEEKRVRAERVHEAKATGIYDADQRPRLDEPFGVDRASSNADMAAYGITAPKKARQFSDKLGTEKTYVPLDVTPFGKSNNIDNDVDHDPALATGKSKTYLKGEAKAKADAKKRQEDIANGTLEETPADNAVKQLLSQFNLAANTNAEASGVVGPSAVAVANQPTVQADAGNAHASTSSATGSLISPLTTVTNTTAGVPAASGPATKATTRSSGKQKVSPEEDEEESPQSQANPSTKQKKQKKASPDGPSNDHALSSRKKAKPKSKKANSNAEDTESSDKSVKAPRRASRRNATADSPQTDGSELNNTPANIPAKRAKRKVQGDTPDPISSDSTGERANIPSKSHKRKAKDDTSEANSPDSKKRNTERSQNWSDEESTWLVNYLSDEKQRSRVQNRQWTDLVRAFNAEFEDREFPFDKSAKHTGNLVKRRARSGDDIRNFINRTRHVRDALRAAAASTPVPKLKLRLNVEQSLKAPQHAMQTQVNPLAGPSDSQPAGAVGAAAQAPKSRVTIKLRGLRKAGFGTPDEEEKEEGEETPVSKEPFSPSKAGNR